MKSLDYCLKRYGILPNSVITIDGDENTILKVGSLGPGEHPGELDLVGFGVRHSFSVSSYVTWLMACMPGISLLHCDYDYRIQSIVGACYS